MDRKRTVGLIAGAAVAAAAVIGAHFEGVRLHTYHDIAGIPTICYGHTKGVKDGQTATPAQCRAWLQQEMDAANAKVHECIRKPMTLGQEVAFTDAVYNAGPKIVCHSTLNRLANEGHMIAACKQLARWVYAGGKKQPGLVKRRGTEMRVCLGEPVIQ